MSGEGRDQAYDSDNDFEKPKDDYLFYHNAFKMEEKKMISHQKFEDITTKYWQLLKDTTETDYLKSTLSKAQYKELMRRVYKVMLPLYRPAEMEAEIEEEWVMDSRGLPDLTFHLLTKVLFRIAHQWCVNIDIEEYIDTLSRIYDRIICYSQVVTNSRTLNISPQIIVTFPQGEAKAKESGGKKEVKFTSDDDWLECRSNESNKSDFDYKYEEDPVNMVVKKYKKVKPKSGEAGVASVSSTIREPIIYNEEVVFNKVESEKDSVLVPRLLDLQQVVPFGFPTETYLAKIKNNVHECVETDKQNKRLQFHGMSKEQREANAQQLGFQDIGLIKEEGKRLEEYFTVNADYVTNMNFKAVLTDAVYNGLRKTLRDGTQAQLRLFSAFPRPGQRSKSRSSVAYNEPIVEMNKVGFNPALERRVSYRFFSDKNQSGFVNVNFMIDHKECEKFHRQDINKVETRGKLCLKEPDTVRKDEEFPHVEHSYKQLRQVMLFKKFESIYQDRASADNKEQKRLKKLIDKEERRKAQALKSGSLVQKGVQETYEEKTFIKMMRGPFFQLDSREGLKEDDFVHCNEQDLIDAATASALRILVIGKPRAGKTTLARNLAQKLDLVHVNVDLWIAGLLERIKAYEPPDDLEEGQEPPRWLSFLEESVSQALLQGGGPSDEQVVEILKTQMNSAKAVLKGFVLDLSFYHREHSWASTIRQRNLLGEPDQMGRSPDFSHVVELWCDDEEVRHRSEGMRVDPETGAVYSKWEREERAKPKPESEDQAEDEEEVKPLDEGALVQRSCDFEHRIKEELHYYNTIERPAMEELLINLYENQYVKVDSAGLTPDEITECVQCRVKTDDDLPLRPLAIQIEGVSDYKSLLTDGLEENQIPRKWSLWKQTDPVALAEGKVLQGLPENAAHFNGNVFVFATEDNLKAFLIEPKRFLSQRPAMPSVFRVLMLGPKGVGKHTQAQMLSDTYGWRIVDYKHLVRTRLEEMMKYEVFVPNNPQGGRIGLSEPELAEVVDGKPLSAWKYVPWVLDFLGLPLEKRKPPPPEEKPEGENEEEEPPQLTEAELKKKAAEERKKREEEERKRREEEELQRYKEDRRRRRQEALEQGLNPLELGIEDSEEEPVIIEDLSIDQLVLKGDELTGKLPFVGGFILLGFPETEEHINRLKAHGIEFDRIIYLNDTNEEEPGAEVKKRMQGEELFDWDWELENSQKMLGLAREHLNEELVREISCNGRQEEVFIRIRNEIDPFYAKVDNPDDVRTSADLGEDDKRLPKGDFGDFCPITYIKDNWLVRGDQEQEVTINGKTYWLAGEKEAEVFKFNPKEYLVAQFGSSSLPLQTPPPRIMVLGHRGAGTSTQIKMLCEKFKLNDVVMKESYLAKLKEEKEKRKRRRLLDRGFRPPQPPDEEGGDPPPDPEIEEDPDDFDRETHEREVMKMIYDNSKGYIIDGTWRDLPEGAVQQPLQDLLFGSRRVPEVVVVLKCKEKATFDRLINREAIRAEFNRLMENREAEKKRLRDADRETYLQEVTEAVQNEFKEASNVDEDEQYQPDPDAIQKAIDEKMATWEEERMQQEKDADENDAEMPNYDAMEEIEREKLREQRTNDDTFFEEFSQVMRDKKVVVVDDIKGDLSPEFVHIKILDRIKDNFQQRNDTIERQLAQPLTAQEVKFQENSYIYKHSKFGIHSPIYLNNPAKTKAYAVLYRERIYFLSNAEEQQQFLKEPSKYAMANETIPLDINYKPKLMIIGLPKSGKTTLCEALRDKIGVVHLRIPDIIDMFIEKDSVQFRNLKKQIKMDGRHIEDDQIINLLLKRVQYKDCLTRGWVLEDFPKTRSQAMFLAKRGLVPTNLIVMRHSADEVYRRSYPMRHQSFGSYSEIFGARVKYYQQNSPSVISFYLNVYNNVVDMDAKRSKWFIQDRAMTEIAKSIQAKQQFAKDYNLRENAPRACKLKNLGMDRCLVRQSLSESRYYCPVTWKNEKLLFKASANSDDCVLYKNTFYYFRSEKDRDLFIANPSRFLINVTLPKVQDLPMRVMPHKAGEAMLHEKALNGHCAVTLMDEERVKKGDSNLLILFKDGKYVFDTEFKLQRFLANPYKYSKATLPVKMPPPEDKISLFNLQKMEDSIAFMEQALGQAVTRGLREVSENRLKHPGMSVKETMLKLFALFLKTENPANTEFMKKKYAMKMKTFIQKCELPEELFDLAQEKDKKKQSNDWPPFKENYYNSRGELYDEIAAQAEKDKADNFMTYIR